MELIPILSLIIMVATVCTFILAVGAYYHYKRKETKREAAQKQQPDFIQAELVTPGPYTSGWTADDYYRYQTPVRGRAQGRESTYTAKPPTRHKFMRYTAAGYLDPLTDKTAADSIRWR
jgi:hypothetical protein